MEKKSLNKENLDNISGGTNNNKRYAVIDSSCVDCGTCLEACSREAIFVENNRYKIDSNFCDYCGACLSACPIGAIHEA